MIEVFKDIFSAETIAWFKADLEATINIDPEDRPFAPEDALRLYGLKDCPLQDRRRIIKNTDPAHKHMREILYKIIPKHVTFYMAYQRQFLPHQMHVDAVTDHTDLTYAKSAIIPLDENINGIFKTIVWDHVMMTNENFGEFMKYFLANKDTLEKLSDTSSTQDVNHCWEGTPSIADYMLLEGVFDYELGSMGMFDRTHVHCSSNWRKYGLVDYKDIILLHIG